MKTALAHFSKICLLAAVLFGLAGFSRGGRPNTPRAKVLVPPVANDLRFAKTVNAAQRAALNESIAVLHALPAGAVDSRLLEIMKVSDLSGPTLQRWVEDRVHTIVGSDFDLEHSLYLPERTGFTFPFPDVFPDPDAGVTQELSGKAEVVMANVGTAIYYVGKKQARLVGLKVPGVGEVPVTSPRVGILQIGPGLFPGGVSQSQNLAYDIYRASTLFHEARHSDGRGKTLGFMHAECPTGHDYAGMHACDYAANGPYTIGARILKNLKARCAACTKSQKTTLDGVYLEIANRVVSGDVKIPSHSPPRFHAKPFDWDDAPEGQ